MCSIWAVIDLGKKLGNKIIFTPVVSTSATGTSIVRLCATRLKPDSQVRVGPHRGAAQLAPRLTTACTPDYNKQIICDYREALWLNFFGLFCFGDPRQARRRASRPISAWLGRLPRGGDAARWHAIRHIRVDYLRAQVACLCKPMHTIEFGGRGRGSGSPRDR